MSENVVALPGREIPIQFGEPDALVIARCEELLADAKNGTVRAVAIATVRADRPEHSIESVISCGAGGLRYALIAAVTKLSHHLANASWPDHGS